VSLRVRKSVADTASPEVRKALARLDGDDIRGILEEDDGTAYFAIPDRDQKASSDKNIARFKRWVDLGLAVELPNDELAETARKTRLFTFMALGLRTSSLKFENC
jgi:hypothetical protein